jgi:hypothetical protein
MSSVLQSLIDDIGIKNENLRFQRTAAGCMKRVAPKKWHFCTTCSVLKKKRDIFKGFCSVLEKNVDTLFSGHVSVSF